MTKSKSRKIQEDARKITLERIKRISGDIRISIGSEINSFTKEELLKSVEKGDEVGKEVINAQMGYLRDVASGAIYKDGYRYKDE